MSVSYLITLYNKEEFIAGVVDAALAEQATTGGEVIIYDDVSTDRSAIIVQERIAAHPAQAGVARLISGEKNRGVAFATNFLVDTASKPYTRLIDADDVLVKGSTSHLQRLLRQHNLGFIHGMTTEVGNYDYDLEKQPFTECFVIVNPLRRILRHAIAGASTSLFETAVLRKALPLPEYKRRTQDFLITLRVANNNARMGYINDVVSIGPSDRTGNNLSAALAAMFAEMSRDVALDGPGLPLAELRYASRRYAARTAKYFRRRGQSKLSPKEKLDLWRWQNLAWFASRQDCIARLTHTADLLDRDRDVMVTGPARPI